MKSLMPWLRVDLHDVPQDRLAADLDHRLGTHIGFFRKTGSQTTSQQYRAHLFSPSNWSLKFGAFGRHNLLPYLPIFLHQTVTASEWADDRTG